MLTLADARKKINEYLMGLNNIDKLMTDKVNDYVLIEEQPLPIKIGDRTIFVGNFTIENNFKFWDGYGQILALIGIKFLNFELIGDMPELYKAIMLHRKLYKALVKLLGKVILKQQAYYLDEMKNRIPLKWKNCSYRYFKKRITIEKLMQICKLVHVFNFDGEKKNFKILLGDLARDQETKGVMGEFMSFWLQNLNGLSGRFQLAQLINVDYWDDDTQNVIVNPIKEMDDRKKR